MCQGLPGSKPGKHTMVLYFATAFPFRAPVRSLGTKRRNPGYPRQESPRKEAVMRIGWLNRQYTGLLRFPGRRTS